MKRLKKLSALLLGVLMAATLLSGCGGKKNTVVILDGEFAEPEIVAEMAKLLIEDKTDLKAEIKDAMTPVFGFNEMNEGKIDLMLSYDGSLLVTFLKHDDSEVPEGMSTYDYAQQVAAEECKVHLMEKLGANNTYSIAVRRETAEKYNLKTFSDLAKVSNQLVISPTLEFTKREDCLPGLKKKYNMNFKKVVAMDSSPRYLALSNGESDVVDAFSTDGLLKKFGLTVLEDDQHFFPPYYAVPVIRSEVLEAHPELEDLLGQLGAVLTDDVMGTLNYQVDEENQDPETVAKNFLQEKGLIA